MPRSLTRRITVLSIVWIGVALVVTGVFLWRLYHAHIQEHYDTRVRAHLQELIAAIAYPDGVLQLTRQPTDPRFQREGSGWYWEVRSGDMVLHKSASLGNAELDLRHAYPAEELRANEAYGPNQERLRAQVIEIYSGRSPDRVTIIATAPESQILEDVQHMGSHVLTGFLMLGVGLSLAVIIQVRLSLKPLKAIRDEIGDIKAGRKSRLSTDFPVDVQPLATELNFLLDHNEMLLKRARNQLGDLAHAVKNPLAVIRNEARSLEDGRGQLIVEQTHLMANQIDRYLSRARMYGQKDAIGFRTSVREVMKDLAYAVGHIYRDRNVDIRLLCENDQWFRGEAQDLEEMAGNLLDNACKWARSVVTVNCRAEGDQMQLFIEDDGPGIAEEHREEVLRRGKRLDETQPGHGQGLGIVADIAKLYNGSLGLSRSALGGLKATLTLPSA